MRTLDTQEYLDGFYRVGFSPENCLCIRQEGNIAAALYWLDMTCDGQKFAYIYAVGTATSARGKGLCRTLMAETAEILKEAGYHGALLVPQDPPLHIMYGKMGYLPATPIEQSIYAAAETGLPITQISAEEFSKLRPAFSPAGSVQCEPVTVAFLDKLAVFYRAPGLLAAVSREEKHLRILDYLGPKEAIPGLVAALGRTEATVRTVGTGTEFAMYYPLDPACKKPGHFTLALD
jgi:predicted GNAT family acetyltransferase